MENCLTQTRLLVRLIVAVASERCRTTGSCPQWDFLLKTSSGGSAGLDRFITVLMSSDRIRTLWIYRTPGPVVFCSGFQPFTSCCVWTGSGSDPVLAPENCSMSRAEPTGSSGPAGSDADPGSRMTPQPAFNCETLRIRTGSQLVSSTTGHTGRTGSSSQTGCHGNTVPREEVGGASSRTWSQQVLR